MDKCNLTEQDMKNKPCVLYNDTDSVYIRMDDLVKQVFGEKIEDKTKVVDFLDKVCSDKMEKLLPLPKIVRPLQH